jgi:MFS transporter, MHS family, proline/betaine transporter
VVDFYLPSYLATALGIPLSRTLAAALVGLLVVAVVAPAFGRLSDRVGRRPLLVAGTVALLLAILPAFLLIRGAEPAGLVVGYLLVALPLASLVVVPAYLAELFPTPVRSTAPAVYATAVAVAAVAAAVAARETAFQPLDGAEEPETELARPGR